MIARFWRGWTTLESAEAYEGLLLETVVPGIRSRNVVGFVDIGVVRRRVGDEVEFVTIMWFDSLDAVRAFAGEDYETAVVPAAARKLLSRFDDVSSHFEALLWPDRLERGRGEIPVRSESHRPEDGLEGARS